jgi:hypothetical protein
MKLKCSRSVNRDECKGCALQWSIELAEGNVEKRALDRKITGSTEKVKDLLHKLHFILIEILFERFP